MIIVDRIENGLAICEIDGVMTDIPLSKISNGIREGDVLIAEKNNSFYTIDPIETEKRKKDITELFERLKARNKKNTP